MKRLSTSKIAMMANCHPNTVRLYEEIGYLQKVERGANGYRLYTPEHADQMVLARRGLDTEFAGVPLRDSAKRLILTAARGDLVGALQHAYEHRELARSELAHAVGTVEQVERWANGEAASPARSAAPVSTTRAARILNVTVDSLRTWERNDLIRVPKNPANGYRLYGPYEMMRLRIIRMLRLAGYSLMAIYRMLKRLDEGQTRGLADVLDTPGAEEDFFGAADRWITTLTRQVERAEELLELIKARLRKASQWEPSPGDELELNVEKNVRKKS